MFVLGQRRVVVVGEIPAVKIIHVSIAVVVSCVEPFVVVGPEVRVQVGVKIQTRVNDGHDDALAGDSTRPYLRCIHGIQAPIARQHLSRLERFELQTRRRLGVRTFPEIECPRPLRKKNPFFWQLAVPTDRVPQADGSP